MLCWKQWLLVNRVVAFHVSSNPELIQHGRTGFFSPGWKHSENGDVRQ